jgi:hypothetical protein
MGKTPRGHRGLSEDEAERIRALYRGWATEQTKVGSKPTRVAFVKLLLERVGFSLTPEAVSRYMGTPEEGKPPRDRPGRKAAQAIAEAMGKPRNFWEDGADAEKPAELDSVRMLTAARDLLLDDGLVLALGGDSKGARMKNLSEQKKKAVLGAVHLLGYPLEMVIEAAEQVTEASDDSPVSLFAKIQTRLSTKQPRSGSYPSTKPPPSRSAR